MSPLPNNERRELLELARRAVAEAVQHGRLPALEPTSGLLANPSGVFITLRLRRRLRGCIGQIEARESLAEAVARCALGAALEDPRFEPVRLEELEEIEIEISALSRLECVHPEQIEVGRHGLLISQGARRGLLLPQVASEMNWSRKRFLEETCVKGGMKREAWQEQGTKIEAFTAEVFSEAEYRVERQAGSGAQRPKPDGCV